MKATPIERHIVERLIRESGDENIGKASIRQIRKLIDKIEAASDKKYIRMEMGIPGLEPDRIAIEAEKKALDDGVARIYPPVDGVPVLKNEISRFVKLFLNIDILPQNCVPSAGSMNGSFLTFTVAGRRDPTKDTVLFIDPGFPVHKQQVRMIGLKQVNFDIYNYRGPKLRDKLESFFKQGNISSVLYSNPNNPTWICFTDEELQIIGELATKYDVVIVEDLAYFAMDFRKDYSVPGEPPFQPSVANYTDNYVIIISSSKAFSYAGQRVGMVAISDKLAASDFDGLREFYPSENFWSALVFGAIYTTTAGIAHSTQYGLAAILKAANDGEFNFVEYVKEYGKRAKFAKKVFLENGFEIVYDMDDGSPIADGFYFTVSYPGFTGEELVAELLYYGISAIALSTTGSEKTEGIRACVSFLHRSQFTDLEERLNCFNENHR